VFAQRAEGLRIILPANAVSLDKAGLLTERIHSLGRQLAKPAIATGRTVLPLKKLLSLDKQSHLSNASLRVVADATTGLNLHSKVSQLPVKLP
jgi:hypothetical protein